MNERIEMRCNIFHLLRKRFPQTRRRRLHCTNWNSAQKTVDTHHFVETMLNEILDIKTLSFPLIKKNLDRKRELNVKRGFWRSMNLPLRSHLWVDGHYLFAIYPPIQIRLPSNWKGSCCGCLCCSRFILFLQTRVRDAAS